MGAEQDAADAVESFRGVTPVRYLFLDPFGLPLLRLDVSIVHILA